MGDFRKSYAHALEVEQVEQDIDAWMREVGPDYLRAEWLTPNVVISIRGATLLWTLIFATYVDLGTAIDVAPSDPPAITPR